MNRVTRVLFRIMALLVAVCMFSMGALQIHEGAVAVGALNCFFGGLLAGVTTALWILE